MSVSYRPESITRLTSNCRPRKAPGELPSTGCSCTQKLRSGVSYGRCRVAPPTHRGQKGDLCDRVWEGDMLSVGTLPTAPHLSSRSYRLRRNRMWGWEGWKKCQYGPAPANRGRDLPRDRCHPRDHARSSASQESEGVGQRCWQLWPSAHLLCAPCSSSHSSGTHSPGLSHSLISGL